MVVIVPGTPAQPIVVVGGKRERSIEIESTPNVWGGIGGNIADQADLQAALASVSGATWGTIGGSMSSQADLQAALIAKQEALVSGVTIKTLNGTTILGSGDIVISGGATNLSYDAASRVVASDTGTDATLTLADVTNAGLMTAAGFTKLAGVALGATANATDAALRDRATHTGTQAVGTITGLGTLATQSGTFSGTSSGANTGDQTSIAGIAGTKAQFNTAASDGDFLFVGDAPTAHTHVAANVTDFSTAADARIGAASINALVDVVITAPSAAQVLKYNGTNWVNDTDATGGGSVIPGTKTLGYTDGVLTSVAGPGSATKALSYTDGALTGVVSVSSGVTVSKTLAYSSGALASVTTVVS